MNDTEKNYSIVEKELYAIVKTLYHFINIILGYSIEVLTDNKNCIFKAKDNTNRIERWKILLNQFDLTIKSISGEENVIADTLSRCLVAEKVDDYSIQSEYKKLIAKFVVLKDKTKDLYDVKNWRQTDDGRFIIKEDKVRAFIQKIHIFGMHTGITTTYYNIKQLFKIPNIKRLIQEEINQCKECLKKKKLQQQKTKESINHSN